MASRRKQDISQYPRPWFYRPEIYYGLIIFPPVWSILTLRSPWHKGEGFFGILIGGVAWFFLIASVVFTVRWVQADDEGHRQVVNLLIFLPGLLLTLITQIQWAAHIAQHGPPPTDADDADARPSGSESGTVPADAPADTAQRAPRRRRRRRRRPVDTPADSGPLC